ncbi:arginyl-tRNA--protein transferase 2-like [Typha angustifolia]|uniref:arginyl-tRNA--protein transferase 2-like n=1 Tax=Typha angustifolia TaxID=59011 RepID=UPI003C2F855D
MGGCSRDSTDRSCEGEGGGGGEGRGRSETVVVDCGRKNMSCGYCESTTRSCIAHGLWAYSMTADDYQELLDHGWRRCGCLVYKPEMEETCCPSYTIRLKASEFVPSRDQARVDRRMQRFLNGAINLKNKESNDKMTSPKDLLNQASDASLVKISEASAKDSPAGTCQSSSKEDEFNCYLSNKLDSVIKTYYGGGEFPFITQLPKAVVKKVTPQMRKKLMELTEDLLYTSSISFPIAAAIRHSWPREKNAVSLGLLSDEYQNGKPPDVSPQTIAETLARSMELHGDIPNFVTRACNGHLNFYSAAKQTILSSADVPIQILKGNEASSNQSCPTSSNVVLPQNERKLEIRMNRSNYDPEEFALFRRYQMEVHNDKQVTEESYKEFLLDTPIIFVPPREGDNTVPPCGFGSFHQQYIIDGKLVAVGVVDILPRCLSSKYLFWDPDFASLSLGKYSILQEIKWVKDIQASCSSIQYYYLGYYIHSCSKMRYKAAYQPSELLCPVHYKWVQYDIAKPLLDRNSYVVLSDSILQDHAPITQLAGKSIDSSRLCGLDESSNEYDDLEIHVDKVNIVPITDDWSNTDISNILIKLDGSLLKFKELHRVLGRTKRRKTSKIREKHLREKLQLYVKVVGEELANRMVYLLVDFVGV